MKKQPLRKTNQNQIMTNATTDQKGEIIYFPKKSINLSEINPIKVLDKFLEFIEYELEHVDASHFFEFLDNIATSAVKKEFLNKNKFADFVIENLSSDPKNLHIKYEVEDAKKDDDYLIEDIINDHDNFPEVEKIAIKYIDQRLRNYLDDHYELVSLLQSPDEEMQKYEIEAMNYDYQNNNI